MSRFVQVGVADARATQYDMLCKFVCFVSESSIGCVLAVIIVVNLRGALRKFADVPRMWRANHVDAVIWLITMATSALINTELGLLVGVLVSAFCVLGRTQRAGAVQLGRAGTGNDTGELYEDMGWYRGLRAQPGVAVCRYEAPIYYANQMLFKRALYGAVGLDPVREKAQRHKREKRRRKMEKATTSSLVAAAGVGGQNGSGDEGVALTPVGSGVAGMCSLPEPQEVAVCSGEAILPQHTSFHTLVLDCSPVLFLDSAGVGALKEVRKDYEEVGVHLLLARCRPLVTESLERGGYYEEKGTHRKVLFLSICDAVLYAQSLSTRNGDCDNC
ncbi:hypothetical protein ACEWY4_016136 [Coilia grayii]|uniref:STAS domain-containing protein n=1 Tax=Coilia grayii TaxID=363190 RepID=A0ABD1JQV2_9TELE